MKNQDWRCVEFILDRTVGDDIGPRTPIGGIRRGLNNNYAPGDTPHGNRTFGRPISYYWRNKDGKGGWIDDNPPVGCGAWYLNKSSSE